MSDPVEEALRAIEAKYYPSVLEGKSLMPFYPREDVALMVGAAVKAERDCCALKAREYALHYEQGSDGRNTFILLAEWIESRASALS